MEYSQEDKKFYGQMRAKVSEIFSLNVPEKEKRRLYSLVEKTIQRYEENKSNIKSAREYLANINEAWEKIGMNLMKLKDSAELLEAKLSDLEVLIMVSRISTAGKKQKLELN